MGMWYGEKYTILNRERLISSINVVGKTLEPHIERMKVDPCFTSLHKNQPKM